MITCNQNTIHLSLYNDIHDIPLRNIKWISDLINNKHYKLGTY